MRKCAFFFIFFFVPHGQFQVAGRIVSLGAADFQRVEIESIGRTFVDYADVDSRGAFSFRNVPEGLYKLTFTGRGREAQRTIEVRPALADKTGRVEVAIEIADNGAARDRLKIGVGALGVSPKAEDELRRAYKARGDVEQARRHLQRAIEISPNFSEALNNLGTIYYHDRQFEKAAALFQRALDANPDSFPAQVNLGGALISLGDYQRALKENFKAIQMRPDDSLAQSQTGQALFYLHRDKEALMHLEEAKRIDPASFTLPGLFIAQIHQLRGEKKEAIAAYKEFLQVHPGNPQAGFVEEQLQRLEQQR